MTGTSLSDRIHRASLENSGTEEIIFGRSPQSLQRGGGGVGVAMSVGGGGGGLAPIMEPGSHQYQSSSSSSSFSPQQQQQQHQQQEQEQSYTHTQSRDSLSYTPFNQLEQQQQHQLQLQLQSSSSSDRQFQNNYDNGTVGNSAIGSPSSAFSAVTGTIGIGAVNVASPPFAFGATTHQPQPLLAAGMGYASNGNAVMSPTQPMGGNNNSIMSGAMGNISSASRTGTGGLSTATSTHYGGAVENQTGYYGASSTHHAHGPRRETSLLVSPVSQRSSLHSHSPQSESNSSHDHQYQCQQQIGLMSSPQLGGLDPTAVVATQHGPTGTPMVASNKSSKHHQHHHQQQQSISTPATAGLTIHTNLQGNTNGRDPTPYHYRSNPSTSPPHNNNAAVNNDKNNHSKKKKESSSDSSIASSRSGRDPPAKSPLPTSVSHGSSDSGFLVTGDSTPNVHSSHYHSLKNKHHGHHGHHNQPLLAEEQQHELSMIEEDESLAADAVVAANEEEENQSLVSNVTGATFVRTPVVRKQQQQFGNNAAAAASGNSFGGHGHHHHHHHHAANHTPRSHAHVRTPGSNSSKSTLLHHATPSTSQLLHRPSLAMRDSLAQLATSTSHALEEIWDNVGVPPDERASQLADLVDQLSVICEEKVQSEERLRDQFRKEIEAAREEWEGLCKALRLDREEDPVAKMRRDPSAKDLNGNSSSGMSLQNEYEAMMGRLESLRSVKQAAMADMEVSQGKIYEAFAALHGCSVEEASGANEMQPYTDIESNLTLEQREFFRRKVDEYEESVTTRTKTVVSLLMDCQSIIRELEIVPPCGAADEVGRCVDDGKIMNSLEPVEVGGENNVSDDGQNYRPNRGQSNNYTIVSLFESDRCIGVGTSSLDRLTSRIAELNGEKKLRRVKLAEMGQAISSLWQMLRVPQEEQQAFTTSIRGLTLDTLRKGEAEIARLDELKSFMIGKLVREQRAIIQDLWEKTNSSAGERASFDMYFYINNDDQLTGEILVKHEQYVATLRSKLEKMQPILDQIARREGILEDRSELELLRKDPERLKGRNYSKQLAKEEKMQNRVNKELPKITAKLEKALRQWYSENKPSAETEVADPNLGHFMYQDTPYLKTMRTQDEEWRTRKERGEQERLRKREEERDAASSANAAFGYSTNYKKLPGKKWNPSTEANSQAGGAGKGSRPRSASNMRSGSNMRGGPSRSASSASSNRSGSNMRFGGRGPLGDVSGSRGNTSRPPSRPRAGVDRGKKAPSAAGYRPASAPRMRL